MVWSVPLSGGAVRNYYHHTTNTRIVQLVIGWQLACDICCGDCWTLPCPHPKRQPAQWVALNHNDAGMDWLFETFDEPLEYAWPGDLPVDITQIYILAGLLNAEGHIERTIHRVMSPEEVQRSVPTEEATHEP
ncbi:MAG: hypothetical protein HRU00_16420 [Myxococcales bacterium]|nr:hypothetical protein [Myxococcales bacterium]